AEILEPYGKQLLPFRFVLLVLEFVALERDADVEAFVLVGDAAAIVEHAAGLDVVAAGEEEGPIVVDLGAEQRGDLLAVAEGGVRVGLLGEEGVREIQVDDRWSAAEQHLLMARAQRIRVEAEAIEHVEVVDRRDLHRADDVRQMVLEARSGGKVDVVVELIALAEEEAGIATFVGEEGPAQAVGG